MTSEPSGEQSARRLRTVVADDDAAIRALVSTVLALEPDFEVVSEAANGVEALQLVSAGDVDLLVLDLSMPEMDGLEVLQQLQATGTETCTVVYTGLIRDGIAQRARRLGARDVVVKGVPFIELVERLRAATDGR